MAKAIYNFYERIELIHVVDKIVDMHILARIERRGHTDCIALTPEQFRHFMELPLDRLYWDGDEALHNARFGGPPESRPEIFGYPDEVQFDCFEILRAVEVEQISPNEAKRRFGDMSRTYIYTDATPPAVELDTRYSLEHVEYVLDTLYDMIHDAEGAEADALDFAIRAVDKIRADEIERRETD